MKKLIPFKHFNVEFTATALVEQQVKIFDMRITEENLFEGLQSGKYDIGLMDGGKIRVRKTGRIIGEIEHSNFDPNDISNDEFFVDLIEVVKPTHDKKSRRKK